MYVIIFLKMNIQKLSEICDTYTNEKLDKLVTLLKSMQDAVDTRTENYELAVEYYKKYYPELFDYTNTNIDHIYDLWSIATTKLYDNLDKLLASQFSGIKVPEFDVYHMYPDFTNIYSYHEIITVFNACIDIDKNHVDIVNDFEGEQYTKGFCLTQQSYFSTGNLISKNVLKCFTKNNAEYIYENSETNEFLVFLTNSCCLILLDHKIELGDD